MQSAKPDVVAGTLSRPPSLTAVLAFVCACLMGTAIGQWVTAPEDVTITFWPLNGIVLAALLANRRGTWPWWLGAALAAELVGNLLWFQNPVLLAVGFSVANVIEVLAAALPLAVLYGGPLFTLATLQQALAFLAIGVVMAPAVGAVLGAAVVAMSGKAGFEISMQLWWLGDAAGTLVALPLTLSIISAWRERTLPSAARTAEAVVIGTALCVPAIWIFRHGLNHEFLLFVPILWAAIRFEMRGAAFSMLVIVAVIAAVGSPSGAAVAGSEIGRHFRVQLFLMVAATTGLVTAAIVRQYRRAAQDLGDLNANLERRVEEGTRERNAAEIRFRTTFENAAVGMAIVSPCGVVLSANDCLCTMMGFLPGGLEGRKIEQFTHPEDVGAGQAAMERLRRGEANHYAMEKRYVTQGGESLWVHTAVSCVRNDDGGIDYLIKIIQDISARKRADTARQMLLYEVSHRSKNLLSLILAIARQTAARSADDFVSTFRRRLQALGSNQDLLVQNNWEQVDLGELVAAQLQHFDGQSGQFTVEGPRVCLSARAAQAIGMAVHELATNAVKYGSLSGDGTGTVRITWTVEGDDFEMSWIEHDGPPILSPGKAGFGTTVIDRVLCDTLDASVSLNYPPQGLMWRVRCKTAALRDSSAPA